MPNEKKKTDYTEKLAPNKQVDKEWFLSLLDEDEQLAFEQDRVAAAMQALRLVRVRPLQQKIRRYKEQIAEIEKEHEGAAGYRKILDLLANIKSCEAKIDEYRCFFAEPYFARMDLTDDEEGYNSYYIGKKGDGALEIVDWRAPVAKRYYQKSCSEFAFNEYRYKVVLRRAIRAKNGEVLGYKNEYLGLKDYLSSEEIKGRDAENILDPYLREIVKSRKEDAAVRDIIETIQEKQYEIITSDEKKNFVLQGCAGSGKTMVMLHRLSYLMYNDEKVRAKNLLVITPSDSFNEFIDELATVLELEKVKTTTVQEYFLRVLDNENIRIRDKILPENRESEGYLEYLYSPAFLQDVEKKLSKVYDNLYGLFTGAECQSFVDALKENCDAQLSSYEWIMNASMRVRRAVLGEIKEKKEGGLYYTKPFRTLMNCVTDVRDFFTVTLQIAKEKPAEYFYRHMLAFYKSAAFVRRYTLRIVQEAIESLQTLSSMIEREIVDLRRYKKKVGEQEILLYADRIERREEILSEIKIAEKKVERVGDKNASLEEFLEYLIGEKTFTSIGKCEDFVDVARYFYRETVKKAKKKFDLDGKMYPSDAYALCVICDLLGRSLTPKHSYVFVDEAQDLSAGEYRLLKRINDRARFNVFGDVEQNVTPYRGVKNWLEVFPDFETYTLQQNYRNTNQIVEYVADSLRIEMQSIGLDGPSVSKISPREITAFFKEKKGLKAVICSAACKEKYEKKSYHVLSERARVSKTKINYMTVYESKGLEFSSVVVLTEGMTNAERYIAYTRALQNLAVVEENG